MSRRGALVLALGVILLGASVRSGALSDGSLVQAILLRIGLGYLAVGLAILVLPRETIGIAIGVALGATILVFVAGLVVRYYDGPFTPTQYGPERILAEAIVTESMFAFAVLPLPAGYVADVFAREGNPRGAYLTPIVAVTLGFVGAAIVSAFEGANPPGTGALLLIFVVVATVAGSVIRAVTLSLRV